MRALIVTAVGVLTLIAASPAQAGPAQAAQAQAASATARATAPVTAPATARATAPAATAPGTARGTARTGSTPYPAAATCVDTARALGSAICNRITRVLKADEKASPEKDQIAVAVVPTTGDASIEDWSTGLFNAWGVGQAGKDNGVLLVVALSDRALRIATGDGLRTRLSDGQASEIVGGTITPLLRAGRTSDAVLAGLDGIRTALGHDVTAAPLARPGILEGLTDPPYDTATTEEPESDSGGGLAWLWVLLLVGIAVVGWLMSLAKGDGGGYDDNDSSSYRRRPYRSFSSSSSRRSSSSSSSRRSSGFGGGRSSGGGASGRW
jgi:uncharacterized protein